MATGQFRSSAIEAVYIFNEHNTPILSHIYTGRPPPPSVVLPQYLSHAAPRPSCIYLPNTNPPTLLFSIVQDNLLFLCPSSTEVEPLLVLEFLHRVADALEEFLGAPLLASRIESSYDVVAQLMTEVCDAGLIAGTEANALRDAVETPTWMGKLLGGVGLTGTPPALNSSSAGIAGLSNPSLTNPALSSAGSQIPWRRSNVRHTSNELYVDLVETICAIFAPSGRPLSAFANGSIACTSKVSGVPDLLLTLTTGGSGGGAAGGDKGTKVRRTMERPVFHPCVRLARWREHGELSFVPPDGRFVLAGYEVDLLDSAAISSPFDAKASTLNLPASVEVKTGLGAAGLDFEVRLTVNHRSFSTGAAGSGGGSGGSSSSIGNNGLGSAQASLSNHLGRPTVAGVRSLSGDSKQPLIEDVTVTIPIPTTVRSISDLRPSKGEAHWSPGDTAVEWKLNAKQVATLNSSAGAILRCSVVGAADDDEDDENEDSQGGALRLSNGVKADTYDYDDDAMQKQRQQKQKQRQNAILMPTSASLGFSVKGWLASGLRVDGLIIDTKRSKGIGEGLRPYKGVKYLTVSKGGVEVRC
ncbi:hypothetical protein AAFC00_001721 [Neodothiora populina]|uniref:MHD domain-containing protein n=1 Tax=Neodothiora populina TaxID=2781224 RepID=A0ABR3PPY0_9PEZI